MAHLLLAIFLIVFGLTVLAGLGLPWLSGILALVSGIFLLLERQAARRAPKP